MAQPGLAVLLLALGLLLLNLPALAPAWLAGDLPLFFYFYVVWGGIILFAFLLARAGKVEAQGDSPDV
ncbi:MAG: hypothetical protein KGN39_03900 [Betaproteobacteria bacterium]|nr:hypothetical protein [Betaproteobacteria bacterium]